MNVITMVHDDSVIIASRRTSDTWHVQIVSTEVENPHNTIWTDEQLLDAITKQVTV